MVESKTAPRTYGMPDPANRQPTPQQGLRGEQGAPSTDSPETLSRSIDEDGRTIAVEEQSGVAWAEATGAAASAAPDPAERSPARPMLLAVAAISGAATAGLLIAAGRWLGRRGGAAGTKPARPAFGLAPPDPENFNQTRDAGPEHIRDASARDWDRVDESSDESFPASDPPSNY